jgi:hypothetical protein
MAEVIKHALNSPLAGRAGFGARSGLASVFRSPGRGGISQSEFQSVSIALWPCSECTWITEDLPVPDIPVMRTPRICRKG